MNDLVLLTMPEPRSSRYILVDDAPVACPDLMKWATWLEDSLNRRVAGDWVNGIQVSTVFLGVDHSFGEGPPLLFETMIFGGWHDQYQVRCSTWEEAEAMHLKAWGLVRRWVWVPETVQVILKEAWLRVKEHLRIRT